MPLRTVTTNYTIQPATDYLILCNAAGTGAAGVTVTFPAAAANTGRVFVVKRVNVAAGGSDQCAVAAPGGIIDGVATSVTLSAPNPTSVNSIGSITLVSDGTVWRVVGASQ